MFEFRKDLIPKNPGVYLFKDAKGNIIYIGKAKNLKNRVLSYFSKNHTFSPKTQALVNNIADLDFIIVDLEVEALLLENKLIKKHKPRYNIDLKDSKTYAYIKLTNEKFPRILSDRNIKNDGFYFGPYTDGSLRREIISLAVKLFKIRTCKILPKKACLNYQIGLCTAPCINNISEAEYKKQVEKAKKFLSGKISGLLHELKNEMKNASKELNFETALERKRQIEAILHLKEKQKVDLQKSFDQDVISVIKNNKEVFFEILHIKKGVISGKEEFILEFEEDIFENFLKMFYSQNHIPKEIIISERFWEDEKDKKVLEKYFSKIRGAKVIINLPIRGEKASLIKLAKKNALVSLGESDLLVEIKDKLNLPNVPIAIECFDISNLGSEHLVGGMTRWVNGKEDKKNYRKFEIKSFKGQADDVRAMKEVVYRRYRRLQEEKSEFPDLIVLDGGRGQLGAGLLALKSLGLGIPIISIAKREEEIFLPNENQSRKFNKNSKMMLFIRKVRDFTHRFVISYNRKKRKMKLKQGGNR